VSSIRSRRTNLVPKGHLQVPAAPSPP
jgi:hypothetical protein